MFVCNLLVHEGYLPMMMLYRLYSSAVPSHNQPFSVTNLVEPFTPLAAQPLKAILTLQLTKQLDEE